MDSELKKWIRVTCRGTGKLVQYALPKTTEATFRATLLEERMKLGPVPRRDQARIYLEEGPNRDLGVPGEMVFATLRNSADVIRKRFPPADDPAFSLTQVLRVVKKFIRFDEGSLDPNLEDGWEPEVDRIGETRYCRPVFHIWGISPVLEVSYGLLGDLTEEFVRQVCRRAGAAHGLGAHRPPGGQCGTFDVVGFEILNAPPNP